MRRLRLMAGLAAIVIGLTTLAPAAASATGQHGPAVANVASRMEAAGWNTVQATHADAIWSGSTPGWTNPTTGRVYRIWAEIGVLHDPYGDYDRWKPYFVLECRRSYGGVTVTTPCNFDVANFRAMQFTSASSETYQVPGIANPANENCVNGTAYTGTTWRFVSGAYPWVLADLHYVRARFLTLQPDCQSLHLTNEYQVGSYRENLDSNDIYYEDQDFDSIRTGWATL